ncbi:MAG: response regulator [Lachnospiraceae bacterium]|nr:response regulator [Lachnospiraceae bacterium]MCR5769153.1 response regulator [Lachnospiraceae bacterium]
MYKVFLVDDDALILEELVEMVPWLDYAFEVAGSETDPVRAVKEIGELKPDVVFCDLKMPGMDGNKLIRVLKDKGIECEFVMLSAYDSFDSVRTFFQQTGFDYILKPVKNEDMELVLERLEAKLSKQRPSPVAEAITENPAFNELITYVGEHYSDKITLNSLAKQFSFSKGHLCSLFQKYFNKSLNLYLTDVRMEHAKELILDKTILIKEVALKSGYSDYYHFFRVFKNHYGVSPKEMREERRVSG